MSYPEYLQYLSYPQRKPFWGDPVSLNQALLLPLKASWFSSTHSISRSISDFSHMRDSVFVVMRFTGADDAMSAVDGGFLLSKGGNSLLDENPGKP